MKMYVMAGLIILLSACQKSSDQKAIYHLIHYYGTIAGISKNFNKGECTWEIGEDDITIDLKVQDPFLRDMTSAYTKAIVENQEKWAIDSLGDFAITKKTDTLFLTAPCCDFIDYILIKD